MATLPTDVQCDAEPLDPSIPFEKLSLSPYGTTTQTDDEKLQTDFMNQLTDLSTCRYYEPKIQQHNNVQCDKSISEETIEDLNNFDIDVPLEMNFPHVDILLLHTEEDYILAKEVKQHFETNEAFVDKEGKGIKVLLHSELLALFNRKLSCMEIGLKHCTYVFMLVTEAFVACAETRFLSEECLVKSLNDKTKKWCFVPVRTNRDVILPFGLTSVSGIPYYRQDEFYFDNVAKILHQRKNLRLEREKKQKEEILKFKKEECFKIKMEKIKQQKIDEANKIQLAQLKHTKPFLRADTQQSPQKDSTTFTTVQPTTGQHKISQSLCANPAENTDVSLGYKQSADLNMNTFSNKLSEFPNVKAKQTQYFDSSYLQDQSLSNSSKSNPDVSLGYKQSADLNMNTFSNKLSEFPNVKAKQTQYFDSSYLQDQSLSNSSKSNPAQADDSLNKAGQFDASSYILDNIGCSKRKPDDSVSEDANSTDSSLAAEQDSSCKTTHQGVNEVHHHTYIIQNSKVLFGNKISTNHVTAPSTGSNPLCDMDSSLQDLSDGDIQTQGIPDCWRQTKSFCPSGKSSVGADNADLRVPVPGSLQLQEQTSPKSSGLSSVLSADNADSSGPVPESAQLQYQEQTSPKSSGLSSELSADNADSSGPVPESAQLQYQEQTSPKSSGLSSELSADNADSSDPVPESAQLQYQEQTSPKSSGLSSELSADNADSSDPVPESAQLQYQEQTSPKSSGLSSELSADNADLCENVSESAQLQYHYQEETRSKCLVSKGNGSLDETKGEGIESSNTGLLSSGLDTVVDPDLKSVIMDIRVTSTDPSFKPVTQSNTITHPKHQAFNNNVSTIPIQQKDNEGSSVDPQRMPTRDIQNKKKRQCCIC